MRSDPSHPVRKGDVRNESYSIIANAHDGIAKNAQ